MLKIRKVFFSTKPSKCFLNKKVVTQRVHNVLTNLGASPNLDNIDYGHFVSNFQLDSLKRQELVLKLSEEFCVHTPTSDYTSLMSVDSAIDYFSSHPKAR